MNERFPSTRHSLLFAVKQPELSRYESNSFGMMRMG